MEIFLQLPLQVHGVMMDEVFLFELREIRALLARLVDAVEREVPGDEPKCPACGGDELIDMSTMGEEPSSTVICGGENGCGQIFEVNDDGDGSIA